MSAPRRTNRLPLNSPRANGSSAICTSTRSAVTICGREPHAALASVTSSSTIVGLSETANSMLPIVTSRPVADCKVDSNTPR
jgi:hypothetical protein